MLDVLEFIFQDFWHFMGSLMLLSVVVKGLALIFGRNVVINQNSDNDKNK